MRLNKYVASSSALSRRAADDAIASGRVAVDGKTASVGQVLTGSEVVSLDGTVLSPPETTITIILNKPTGYVCSRNGQGSRTIYDLLPTAYQSLNPAGRLDKESSGLLIMSNDGALLQSLTHPSNGKNKVYEVLLDKPLQPLHQQMITDFGVALDDGPSKFIIQTHDTNKAKLTATLQEGRNRQIRRTFSALGYDIVRLHRSQFGPYSMPGLKAGAFIKQP